MPILNRRFSLLQKTLANLAWQRLSGPRCKIQKNRNTIYHKMRMSAETSNVHGKLELQVC